MAVDQQLIDTQSLSYRLWRQALSGDPDGALLNLEQMEVEALNVLSADLLARLYVRSGRLVKARTVWQRILQADPNYAPAVKALSKLNSPWLVRAVAKKCSLCFGVGVLLLFALYGLCEFLLGDADFPYPWMGMSTVLAALGIYLAGLFGWVYLTTESWFGFGQSIYSPRTKMGRGRESQLTSPHASATRHKR